MQLNIERLVPLYRLSAEQYNNILGITKECISSGINDKRSVAYILATTKWETAHTFKPIKEFGGIAYFIKRYWTNSKVAKWLGNDNAEDAAKYFGRGYVQITGENNYDNVGRQLGVDLLNNPNLALQPDIAAKIAVKGMIKGWFTGKKLTDYFGPAIDLPLAARRIINGTDKAQEIANIYTQILNLI